jgi:hypothetical protein
LRSNSSSTVRSAAPPQFPDRGPSRYRFSHDMRLAVRLAIGFWWLVATVLGGCGQSPTSTTGPLGESPAEPFALVCVPVSPQAATFIEGETVLANGGSIPVTVRDVRVLDSENIRLDAAYLYDASDGFVGTAYGRATDSGKNLRAKVGDEGATVKPGEQIGILVELTVKDPASEGRVGRFEVWYSGGGDTYRYVTGYTVVGSPDCSSAE